MKYSKLQKSISYLLLSIFFLNISVNIPSFFSVALAKNRDFYNLVSVIVDEETYKIMQENQKLTVNINNSLVTPNRKNENKNYGHNTNTKLLYDIK